MLKRRFGPKTGKTDSKLSRRAGSNGSDRAEDEAREVASALLDQPQSTNRATRLEQARALLKQATSEQADSKPASKPLAATLAVDRATKPQKSAHGISKSNPSAFTDPFEDTDPFEAFEQCVPTERPAQDADAATEPVYTRSSQRTRKTSATDAKNANRPQRSLKGRALAYLSRREYSRAELSRKLRPYVEEAEALEIMLDGLERDGWLSNERFVESVVHRRAGRMGGSRIIHELKRHAVGETLIGETADKLKQTETARAQAVWEKKYGVVPETPAERAKQARFLAARGFSGSTIGKVLKGVDEDWSEEIIDD